MAKPLLQTKLYPPTTRTTLVPREHLLARSALHDADLTLVHAPTGYGKTTFVVDWLARANVPVAWLSLDAGDNDPARFLRYLAAALAEFGDAPALVGVTPRVAADGRVESAPSLVDAVARLIDSLSSDAPTASSRVLVLDDYHIITSEPIHAAMNFLLAHAPPTLHVVLISRTLPPLTLARLRAQGRLVEVTAADLQFSRDEAAAFLNEAMALDLAPESVSRLVAHTEGWVAALHLAGLSLRRETDPAAFVDKFSGEARHVADYLAEEVLQRQPPDVRDFLLHTSVLSSFNAELCAAVTGSDAAGQSRQMLERLERDGLFVIALDGERRWYRYHHLFADFLRARLARTSPDPAPALHARASDWFAANGQPQQAVEHGLAAGDFARVAAAIEVASYELVWRRGEVETVLGWLAPLPQSTLLAHPPLALALAWARFAHGEHQRLSTLLDVLEPVLSESEHSQADAWRGQLWALRGQFAAARQKFDDAEHAFAQARNLLPSAGRTRRAMLQGQGYLYRLMGNIEPALEVLTESLQLGQDHDDAALQLFALYDLAEVQRIAGRLGAAQHRQDEALAIIQREPQPHQVHSIIYLSRGHVLFKHNELDAAAQSLERALELSQPDGFYGLDCLIYCAKARLSMAAGQLDEAERLLQQALDAAHNTYTPWILAFAETEQIGLYLLRGHIAKAEGWLARVSQPDAARDFVPSYQRHREQIMAARVFLTQGKPSEAIALLQSLAETAIDSGWRQSLIQIEILLALAYQAQDKPRRAQDYLVEALVLGEAEGYVRPFVDEGASLANLLRSVATRAEVSPAYLGQLQAAFLPSATNNSSQPLLDPLTERELEVLRLMAAGFSNREIADELIIAIGTVAKYSNNIFTKLNVRNRTEAVTQSQGLGLV